MTVQDHGVSSIGPIGVTLGVIIPHSARYYACPFRKLPPGPRGYPIIGKSSMVSSSPIIFLPLYEVDPPTR